MEGPVQTIFLGLAPLMGAVWLASEFIGRTIRVDKDIVALILGPVGALVMHALGWLQIGSGLWGWVAAVVFGLIATALTAVGHDKLIKPAMKMVGKAKG